MFFQMNDSQGGAGRNLPSPRSGLFGLSLPFRRSKAEAPAPATRLTVSQIKLETELCFQEIEGMQADRLRMRVRASQSVQDLWMLRSDIHQLLAQHFNQIEASHRINVLLPCFAGWIPDKQLLRI